MQPPCDVHIRFFLPPEALRRYFTTFYLAEIDPADGGIVTDYLHPEWANLRFHSGGLPDAECRDGTRVSGTGFTATGPSCETVRFQTGRARIWGIGLLPLGWAKFVRTPAAEFANALVDGYSHPAFACFTPLATSLFSGEPDCDAEFARIAGHFGAHINEPVPDEDRICAIHAALIDAEIKSVGDLVARVGGSSRTVERICRRAFGFSPKKLLRRQRFMRSLAQFMLDPSRGWSDAMDGHYYDQAQFVRDCKQFLGMTPRAYAALPKPILTAVMEARTRLTGAAVQTFDDPRGGGRRA